MHYGFKKVSLLSHQVKWTGKDSGAKIHATNKNGCLNSAISEANTDNSGAMQYPKITENKTTSSL